MSAAGWIVAALSAVLAMAGLGMTGHMMAHMAAVAVAAPLIALGRIGQDTEIAALTAFLSGPDADFITGAALTADGGYLA